LRLSIVLLGGKLEGIDALLRADQTSEAGAFHEDRWAENG